MSTMPNNQVWMLFSCCIPVKGSRRSLIYDLQRGRYYFIPNAMYELITLYEGKPLEEAKAAYQHEHDAVIDQYIAFLFNNELAFHTDTPDHFPKISLEWKSALHITNAVIDTTIHSNHDYNDIITQLSQLGCAALQCRFYEEVTLTAITSILAAAKQSRLRSVELVIPYQQTITEPVLDTLMQENKRLNSIIIHSAPTASRQLKPAFNATLVYTTEVINDASHCGFINASHFRTNIELFTEAQAHNSCLNRKVGIDVNGNIKNCPSATQAFGNVQHTSLESVISQSAFRKAWDISKDKTAVCKDCEFRYMCVDCRVFVADENDPYSKPSKCSYDPYTAQWLNETENPQSKLFRTLETTSSTPVTN
ncbi:SPASM domain peptide maturase of grasp-with-spasm system [Chitinophaga dinghuensis]|uniref:SPASM domain peptide maturase of grasp-with-spasm system n=1 Tax=Chitinophaga dinghuensis TaxID=1539050 RepID=A0A327W3U9_9BACT|nr:grasp-with-spasm system SPASM domain peptide maturase [Chitinophaga dinghuensis]RAJ83462.1 SPASM domain peptide maturase of grasp-with-spasm system [Chitinophaga dinghuensis]